MHFKAALFLGHHACAADNRQNGDGYVVVDEELSSRIVIVFVHPADPSRRFLVSSFLPLFVYLLFLPLISGKWAFSIGLYGF
jgi:hypothetical protein